jgi:hypothetical protein
MRDHRGQRASVRPLSQIDPRLQVDLSRERRIAELHRELERTWYRRSLQAAAIGSSAGLVALFAWLAKSDQVWMGILIVGIPLVLLVAVVALGSRGVWRRELARLEAAPRLRIAGGMCIGCGYSLEDLPCEADGCTVCPECGAAWKLATD